LISSISIAIVLNIILFIGLLKYSILAPYL